MKYFNKIILFSVISGWVLTGCYDGVVDNLKSNSTMEHATDSVSSISTAAGLLITAQELLIDKREHKYQYQFNLHMDNYCGYMCLPHNFQGRIKSTYVINDDFASGPKANMTWVAQQVVPVMASAKTLKAEPLGAIANILYSYEAHLYSGVHGPFPYNDYKVLKEEHPLTYNSVEDIYDSIFLDLQRDVDILLEYKKNPDAELDRTISSMDKIAGGKVDNWIKFANSLRLRMAMNMVKAAPDKAQRIAEEAIKSGVLEASDNDIALDVYKLYLDRHPLFKISSSWVDSRLNANLHNILKRTGHPMLEEFFSKNSADIYDISGRKVLDTNSDYLSMRNGSLTEDPNTSPTYLSFSKLSTNFSQKPLEIFKVSEVYFLRAEGALRGWAMGGTPEHFYNEGIRTSFKEFGFSDKYDQYIVSESVVSVGYRDYYDLRNNAEGVMNVCNKWSNSDSKEVMLEKIITQKWIALFPMSAVAWADMRRTGYPRMISPVKGSFADGDGSIDPLVGIRRIPYAVGGDNENKADIETSAIPVLNGPDQQSTRLWWDIDIANF